MEDLTIPLHMWTFSSQHLLQEEKSHVWKRVLVSKSFWKRKSIYKIYRSEWRHELGQTNKTKLQHAENHHLYGTGTQDPNIFNTPRNVKISGANSEMPPPCKFIFAVAWAICNTKLASIMMFTWSIQSMIIILYVISCVHIIYRDVHMYMCIYIYIYQMYKLFEFLCFFKDHTTWLNPCWNKFRSIICYRCRWSYHLQ